MTGRSSFAVGNIVNLGMIYPFPPQTVEIPGRKGLYVICMYPHSRT